MDPREKARQTRAAKAYRRGMAAYTDASMRKAQRTADWLEARGLTSGPYGSPGAISLLRSPWAWLLPAGLAIAAYSAKPKAKPGLWITAAAALLVVNGVRPPGARRFP